MTDNENYWKVDCTYTSLTDFEPKLEKTIMLNFDSNSVAYQEPT
jgi:hypothetical protein